MATAADAAFAKKMSAYWIAFAKTGEPSPEGLPEWPEFTKEGDALMKFGTGGTSAASPGDGIESVNGFRKRACDYWENLYNEDPDKQAYLAHVATGKEYNSHQNPPISTLGSYGPDVVEKLCRTMPSFVYPASGPGSCSQHKAHNHGHCKTDADCDVKSGSYCMNDPTKKKAPFFCKEVKKKA